MDSIFPKLNDLTTRWTFTNTNTTLLQLLNSNQINIIQNTYLKEELITFNQQIDLFTRNTNINNTNLVDNLTTGTFISSGGFAPAMKNLTSLICDLTLGNIFLIKYITASIFG